MKATPPNNHSLYYPCPFDISFLSYVSWEEEQVMDQESDQTSRARQLRWRGEAQLARWKKRLMGRHLLRSVGGGAHGTHARLRTTRLETGLKFEHPSAGAK